MMSLLDVTHRHVDYLLACFGHWDVDVTVDSPVLDALLGDDLRHMDDLLDDVLNWMLHHSGHLHQLLYDLHLGNLLDDLMDLHVRHLHHLLLDLAVHDLLGVLLRDLRRALHLFCAPMEVLRLRLLPRSHDHCMVLRHGGVLWILDQRAGHWNLPNGAYGFRRHTDGGAVDGSVGGADSGAQGCVESRAQTTEPGAQPRRRWRCSAGAGAVSERRGSHEGRRGGC
mmetsp:Transcript_97390/g.231724  ORF Transcript_97390/g.231724 Transcript_97390/m.231724 type:complete len:225 (-) Transcript_97390:639-1313(-)